jgi:hypothetical protein
MASIELSPQQTRAIAVWCVERGSGKRVLLESASYPAPDRTPGDIAVTRDGESAVIAADGAFMAERTTEEPSPDLGNRFAFITPGTAVRARVGMRLAIELAANGARDAVHELGHKLISTLHGTDEPLSFVAEVKFPHRESGRMTLAPR